MELKVSLGTGFNRRSASFQSHLYGIERGHCVGVLVGLVRFNRTFMELKGLSYLRHCEIGWFQSHLYGIESAFVDKVARDAEFQSHLYGIEREWAQRQKI